MMKYIHIIILSILLLTSCRFHYSEEHIRCFYFNEEKPFDRISIELKVKSLFSESYKDFDKNNLVEVFFYTNDPGLDESENRIVFFVFDNIKSKILILNGKYELIFLSDSFPIKPIEELKLLCKNLEEKYYYRDCEIEDGRIESLTIFKNNILQYTYVSRGKTIDSKEYINKSAIKASILCKKLIKLSRSTKAVK